MQVTTAMCIENRMARGRNSVTADGCPPRSLREPAAPGSAERRDRPSHDQVNPAAPMWWTNSIATNVHARKALSGFMTTKPINGAAAEAANRPAATEAAADSEAAAEWAGFGGSVIKKAPD